MAEKYTFVSGENAGASSGLPALPVSFPTAKELSEARQLREDAPLLAELLVERLYMGDFISVTQVGPLQKQLADALAKPKMLRVQTERGVVEISEVEHMIRKLIPGGYPSRPTPVNDPWAGEVTLQEKKQLDKLIEAAQEARQMSVERALTAEERRALVRELRKMHVSGSLLGLESLARSAGISLR